MNIYSISKTVIKSMAANKIRTFLTVLGMVIGVTSIVIVFSAGAGVNNLLSSQISSFGTNIIDIEIKVPTNKAKATTDAGSAMSLAMGTQVTTLTLDDLDKMNQLSNIQGGYGAIFGQDLLSYGAQRKKINLFGTTESYINIDQSKIASGRFFSESEDRSLAKVAVIGSKIKNDIFGDQDPIGKEIQIGKLKFTIIGTMKARGAGMGLDYDTYVYIPIRTLQKRVMGINHLMYSILQLKDPSKADATAEDVRYLLRQRHNIEYTVDNKTGQTDTAKDDFRVTTMKEMMDTLNTVTNAITILLLAIVAISLIVGGVGIMNIMYVIVSERTAEIGLRKAVGARYGDIMGQFLIEAIIVTLSGALVGIIIGTSISYLIAVIAQSQNLDWTFVVPIRAYVVSILFSLFCGLVFGIMPARKAAKLDPIVALRNE